jgi:hypothetical protein
MDNIERKIGLFDFLNSVSFDKNDLLNENTIKEYSPYMINRFLSAEQDTVEIANFMNELPNLDKRMHYNFLRFLIPKRKRFFKYLKTDKIENEELLKQVFQYSPSKAKEVMSILGPEDYEQIRKQLETGGIKQETNPRTKRTRKKSA